MNTITQSSRHIEASEDERKIRCDLAAPYRLLAHIPVTDCIPIHLSARLPGPEHHFLLNRFGAPLREMRAPYLAKVDFVGTIVDHVAQPGEYGTGCEVVDIAW